MYSIESATKYAELTELERWAIQDPTPDPDPTNYVPWAETVNLFDAWEGLGDKLAWAARAAWANGMTELAENLEARAAHALAEADRLDGVARECGRAYASLPPAERYTAYLVRASHRPLRNPQPFEGVHA